MQDAVKFDLKLELHIWANYTQHDTKLFSICAWQCKVL